MTATTVPDAAVLAAWGRAGHPVVLRAGVVRVGDLVFKRGSASPAWLRWEHLVLEHAPDDGIRLQRIVPALDGRLVVGGWVARTFLVGRHRRDAWTEILDTTERVTASLGRVPASIGDAPLPPRQDPWAFADRMAWDEEPVPERLSDPVVRELLDLRRRVTANPRLVHADMWGNVVFADGLPPGVIDFSPYRRPEAYPLGVVIADAVVWHAAPISLVERVAAAEAGSQGLVRALLFRHLTARLLGRGVPDGAAGGRDGELRAAIRTLVRSAER